MELYNKNLFQKRIVLAFESSRRVIQNFPKLRKYSELKNNKNIKYVKMVRKKLKQIKKKLLKTPFKFAKHQTSDKEWLSFGGWMKKKFRGPNGHKLRIHHIQQQQKNWILHKY